MRANGGWTLNDVEEFPILFNAAKGSNGLWYLPDGETNDDESDPTIIEVQADGTYIEYPLPGNYSICPKSTVAVGNKICIMLGNSGREEVTLMTFHVLTKEFAFYSAPCPGINSPLYAGGAVGPNGKVYWAPVRDYSYAAPMKPFVYNPVANTVGYETFNDTWITDHYGLATLGGDGLMYFTPGAITAAGGGFSSGEHMMVANFTTMTCTNLLTPPDPIWEDPEDTFQWAMPNATGIYAYSFRDGIWKCSLASGWTLLATSYIWSDFYVDNGELTESCEFDANAVVGKDGKIYAFGYTYRSSLNYTPVMMWINPANDEVHFLEYPSMTGHPFMPTITYPHGDTFITVSLYRNGWDPFFKTSYPIADGTTPYISFARGAVTRSLAVGSTMVSGWKG